MMADKHVRTAHVPNFPEFVTDVAEVALTTGVSADELQAIIACAFKYTCAPNVVLLKVLCRRTAILLTRYFKRCARINDQNAADPAVIRLRKFVYDHIDAIV